MELQYLVWVAIDPALSEHLHAHYQYLFTDGKEPKPVITTPMSAGFAWDTEVR
jgi:hypothetical protein